MEYVYARSFPQYWLWGTSGSLPTLTANHSSLANVPNQSHLNVTLHPTTSIPTNWGGAQRRGVGVSVALGLGVEVTVGAWAVVGV